MATALTNPAERLLDQGKLAESKSKYEEALAIFTGAGQKGKTTYQLIGLGAVLHAQGELASAREKYEEVVTMVRENQDKHPAVGGTGSGLAQRGGFEGGERKIRGVPEDSKGNWSHRHTYSDYRVFSVDWGLKPGDPK
jgi:tetratricopeptide (TPR) repeat protein